MKLRYYLRGLGIGMLVAALVLILSGNTGGKMSDEAIKHRAAELGMVEKDKTVLGDIGSEVSAGQPEDVWQSAITEDMPVLEEEKDTAAEETDEVSEEDKGTAGEEIDGASEERADEVADRAKDVAENSVPKNIVTFEVRSGDSSDSVARRAEEMGLVKSAADFDAFLCQNGYDKRISVGSYEIEVGATEREIADIVTRSR